MDEFLAKEGVTGGLHGMYPPKNSTQAWGQELWKYFNKVGDAFPKWGGNNVFVAMPAHAGNFSVADFDSDQLKRMNLFSAGRKPTFYTDEFQSVHHLHFRGDEQHRLVFHFYGFVFFADVKMQDYYKRFIRDFMRYKDVIQCGGHELVKLIRHDARSLDPLNNPTGNYYALHVRRGDFQFKVRDIHVMSCHAMSCTCTCHVMSCHTILY